MSSENNTKHRFENNIDTKLLHAGYNPGEETGPRSRMVPIHQTTSYLFQDSDHAADLFNLDTFGHIYTRLSNPTTEAFELRVAAMEGGVGALATGSGMAAIALALLNITQAGDEIVAGHRLYGGSLTLLKHTVRRFGISAKLVDVDDLEAVEAAITPKTKALFTETIGNPGLNVVDIEALANLAHRHGIPLIVDNTVAPYLVRPIDHGADVVVYSATKFIGGHGNSIGGVIVDSGKFDWTNGKFPLIAGPDPAYHGVDFVEKLKPLGNLAYIVKARTGLMRNIGPALAPFNAFLLIQGLETLHLRMPRHCENALKVARFLESHPAVSWVRYPGLESSPYYERAKKFLSYGGGAIVGFGIKGGRDAGKRFIDSLGLVSHLANIGDARTLAIHPATTTHQQLSPEEQVEAGVEPDFIRLSIGIEHADDIIADIENSLTKAQS